MDLAELGIKASTQGVTQAAGEVDRLNASASRVNTTLGGFAGVSRDFNTATGMMGSQLGGVVSAFAAFNPLVLGAITALAGFAAAALSLDAFIDATVEAEKQQAQLAAALKSTGGASGQTMESLNAHAAAMQNLTNYEDDAISKSQALLLTFTKIGGDVFPKATEAIADLAERMGGDLQGATIQVGKALNNPIQGITALSRAGIQFTEDQKAMIKTMVEANNIVGAQTVILKELETQFGGSAEAARATLGGAIISLQNAFGNLFEVSGPATENLRQAIEQLIKAISDPAFKDFANTIGSALFDALNVAVKGFALLAEGVSNFWAYAGPTIKELYQLLWDFGSIVLPAVGEAIQVMWGVVEPVITYFLEGWKNVYEVVKQVIDLMNSAPEVPTAAAPAATDAAAPIVNAGAEVAADIAGAMNTGAKNTATAITSANASATKTATAATIDTAAEASKIGSATLANSFGEGAGTLSEGVGAGGDAAAAAVEAAGNVMAAKFEGTGRNIYDLWNNWGDSFIDSFGTSIGELLIDFQRAQTAQLEAQAQLLQAQANLVNEQTKRLQSGKTIDGSSNDGGSDYETSTGTFSFGNLDGDTGGGGRRRGGGNRGGNVGNFDMGGDTTDKDKNKRLKLDERGNVTLNIKNMQNPRDVLDNMNTAEGGRTVTNVIGNNRRQVRRILGIRG